MLTCSLIQCKNFLHMCFQIFKKFRICQTRVLDSFCQSAVNLTFRQCLPCVQIQIYFLRLVDQSDQIRCQRCIDCCLAAHRCICCRQKTGSIINKWYTSAVSSCNKSCQICNYATANSQNTTVSAITFFQHCILQHRLCLPRLALFPSREDKHIRLESFFCQLLFQWSCIQRFHIAVCNNCKFMNLSCQPVFQIGCNLIHQSVSDFNLIRIIHNSF